VCVVQECNSFLKRKVLARDSKYQSRAIPVPQYGPVDDTGRTFVGRLFHSLLVMTDPRRTIHSSSCAGWFDATGR
jgi:WASH complex subunit strumpellin